MSRGRRRQRRKGIRVLGITGGIGSGKSTAAAMLRRLGVPVFSADACVHCLLARGGAAVAAVARAFPGTDSGGGICRAALGRAVFDEPRALARLEAILHPYVRAAEHAFIRRHRLAGHDLCALEIPLLFETGAETLCDAVVVLTVPRAVQDARVLARPGMTPARLAAVRARQMRDADRRVRADFLVETGLGKRHTFVALRAIVARMREKRRMKP